MSNIAGNAVALQAMIDAIDTALGTGAMRVHFQDRSVDYRSTKDMYVARNGFQQQLDALQGVVRVRQRRVYTTKGFDD